MFALSKLLSAITQPVFWLALWWGFALLLLGRRRRVATAMLWAGLITLGGLGFQAIPDALLRPLENRYPVPDAESVKRQVGIIVLGGVIEHPDLLQSHGQVPLGEAAERITVPLALLRQHPRLELVFSGGEGHLIKNGTPEAELARAFFLDQGLDMRRVRLEGNSRTTRENAMQVAALLGERCMAPWLLITSASHMPRAVAEFEAVGCWVTPYPVDFRTGTTTSWTEYSLARSLMRWQVALHEWLGIKVYEWTR